MIQRTFPAEVLNGQLHFDEALTDLEGRHVVVRLDIRETPETLSRLPPSGIEDEAPEFDLSMISSPPFRQTGVFVQVRDGGRLAPCLIFPEVDDE